MAFLRDLRHAFRMLGRAPTVTAVALFSIAITIGATAVVFTAIKSVLIKPLPYAQADRLVQFRTETKRGKSHADWVTWSDMLDLAHNNRSFQSIGIYQYALFNLTGDRNNVPEALYGLSVSASLFPTLGVTPMLGRNILPEENLPGRNNEMILSHGLWVRRFNSDPGVIGRSIEVNGHAVVIIGVMPPDFDFPLRLATSVRTPSGHMDFWAPRGFDPAREDRNTGSGAVARLRPGVTVRQAEQELRAFSETQSRLHPVSEDDRTTMHAALLRDRTLGFARTGLMLLMAGSALFLLIGCANVANVLLARSTARSQEMAIRLALGAGRGRIVRLLVSESCVLGVMGGILGYGFAVVAWTLLPSVAPMTIPRLAAGRADGSVFAFALLASLVNGLLFGIAPALGAARRNPENVRGVVGQRSNTLRSSLVVAEIAIAVVLVVIGGLLTGSFVRLLRTDTGFEPDRVLASIIIPSGDQYRTPESHAALFQRILEGVRALPGVEKAGAVDALPFSGENNGGVIGTGDRASEQIAEVDRVSADYPQAMGLRLLDGRWLREDDMQASRSTALIDEVAARTLWPGQSALGKRFCVYCSTPEVRQWKQVVGVVKSAVHARLDQATHSDVYYAAGALESAAFLVVRTDHPAPELANTIRRAVAKIDPKQPVFLSASMSALIGDSVADRRFIMTLLAITGFLALLLAAFGIYGVMAYATSQRTREIGVRMALGATAKNVLGHIFREGMMLAMSGILIGVTTALALTRLLATFLEGLSQNEPGLILASISLVFLAAALACYIPARRATRTEPMAALRTL